MFPPFDTKQAEQYLTKVIQLLKNGQLKLVQQARPSQERKNAPVMIGVLVCHDREGKIVLLLANSGNAKSIDVAESTFRDFGIDFIIVPPVVSASAIESVMQKNDAEIHRLTEEIRQNKNDSKLKSKMKELCSGSLEKVYNLYSFNSIDGTKLSLKEICAQYNKSKLPPTGTGDCCEPKLLQYVFSHDLQPLSMAQCPFPSENINLIPPCDERCGILLPAMLGLRILYRDEHIIVVNKQSGLLSVPGRGPDKQDCIVNRVKRLFPETIEQPSVHRLDMETSGLMVLAFTKEAHRNLNSQFENKLVKKEYIALLDGILAKKGIAETGQMELFFRLDVDNRPHQIWDKENGKSAITEWRILDVERYHAPDGTTRNATRILYKPHTGRTHQLRLASADEHGFGVPIIGDTLYGKCDEGERLMLHAQRIEFTHPATGEKMEFFCDSEF